MDAQCSRMGWKCFSLRLYGSAVNVSGRLPKQGGCEAAQEGEAQGAVVMNLEDVSVLLLNHKRLIYKTVCVRTQPAKSQRVTGVRKHWQSFNFNIVFMQWCTLMHYNIKLNIKHKKQERECASISTSET